MSKQRIHDQERRKHNKPQSLIPYTQEREEKKEHLFMMSDEMAAHYRSQHEKPKLHGGTEWIKKHVKPKPTTETETTQETEEEQVEEVIQEQEITNTANNGGSSSPSANSGETEEIDRSSLKGSLYDISKALGPAYDYKKLQKRFFGDLKNVKNGLPGWRNEIIRFYLLEGWRVTDPTPVWAHFKYIGDGNSKSDLAIYTPLTGKLGEDATFGFAKWDLGLEETDYFYSYIGTKAAFFSLSRTDQLISDHNSGFCKKVKAQTKVEQVFEVGDLVYENKTAIQLAYLLIKQFEEEDYINSPNGKGFLSHHEHVSLKDQLLYKEDNSLDVSSDSKSSLSRNDSYIKLDEKGVQTTTDTYDKNTFIKRATSLQIAKEKLDKKELSAAEIEAEGLAANLLISRLNQFKTIVAKALLFKEMYASQSEHGAGTLEAEKSIKLAKLSLVQSYLYPESFIGFEKAEAQLAKAYSVLHEGLYEYGAGVFTKRLDFAHGALPELQEKGTVDDSIYEYINNIVKNTKIPKQQEGKQAIDLAPFLKLELAVGIFDIIAQVELYNNLIKVGSAMPRSGEYLLQFNEILNHIGLLIINKEPGYEKNLFEEVLKGRAILQNSNYVEAIKQDSFAANVEENVKKSIHFTITTATLIASFWAAGALGAEIGSMVHASYVGTALESSATALASSSIANVATASVSSTMLTQAVKMGFNGEDFSWEKLGLDFLINAMTYGYFEFAKVRFVTDKPLPGVEKVSEGIYKETVRGREYYYIDKALTGRPGHMKIMFQDNIRIVLEDGFKTASNATKSGGAGARGATNSTKLLGSSNTTTGALGESATRSKVLMSGNSRNLRLGTDGKVGEQAGGSVSKAEGALDELGIPDAINHVKFRDFNVPRKRGIGGAHDVDEWAKIRQFDATNNPNYQVPVGKTADQFAEVVVLKDVPHPSTPGVRTIEYKIPGMDGNVNPNVTTGSLKGRGAYPFEKTIYDPKVWPDSKLKNALNEALNDALRKNNGSIPFEWDGITKEGYRIRGYYRDGKVTSFFFD